MKKTLFIPVLLAMLLLAVGLACSGSASTPTPPPVATATVGPAPTPTLRAFVPPPDQGRKYSVPEISTGAIALSDGIIESRQRAVARLTGIAIFLIVMAIGIWVPGARIVILTVVVVVGLILGLIGNGHYAGKIPDMKDQIGHALADKSITEGVDFATRAQATNQQYIHALVSMVGMDVVPCEARTVNSTDFCTDNTPYYTNRDINSHQVCVTRTETDSDGNTSTYQDCHEEHDEEYRNWFQYISKYWVVVETRAKYLEEQIYKQKCLSDDGQRIEECHRDEYGKIDDKRKPVVYLHPEWRAPEDVEKYKTVISNIWGDDSPPIGSYNNYVPADWRYVRDTGEACGNNFCGNGFVATFAGPYFNWGFAADSPLYEPYTGHYEQLLSMVSLPQPEGRSFPMLDAFGNTTNLQTSLYGPDGDMPLRFDPVKVIGSCVRPEQISGFSDYAMTLQGHFGPNKQGSLRWYVVCDSTVRGIGGMTNMLTALKAYERDSVIHGLFSMPKNLVIIVTTVSDDGTTIVGRGMETGMPAGNILVRQEIFDSVGQPMPFTKENMFGSYTGLYTGMSTGRITYGEKSYATTRLMSYEFSDMAQAGGVAGYLYATDPNYAAPDPSDPSCTLPKPDHRGFVRYSTCNSEYLKTTIQVNEDGYNLIMASVQTGATEAVPVWGGWVFLIIAIFVAGASGYYKMQEF
jgi:hypothetical protein